MTISKLTRQLLTATILVSLSSPVMAAGNTLIIDQTNGSNDFGTDVNPAGTGGNTVKAHINGVNHAYIVQSTATNSTSDTQQNGAGNSFFIGYAAGTTESSMEVYQGNSAAQAALNKQVVNVANKNDTNVLVNGKAMHTLVVQKGDNNQTGTSTQGDHVNVLVVQEMTQTPADDLIDSKGNHYKGGNDSQVNAFGANIDVSVNQYQGNVSKAYLEGSGLNVKVNQTNSLWDFNRKFNHASTVIQKGANLSANVTQSGAADNSTVAQYGVNLASTVTQTNGGGLVTILQAGDALNATVSQTAPDTAIVTQYGGHNDVKITQTGITTGSTPTGSSSKFIQDGNGSKVTITQASSGTFAGGNVIDGTTSGSAFTATTSDGVGGTYTVPTGVNAAWAGQKGDNQTLTLSQTGQHKLYFQQLGQGETATVTQTGDNSLARFNQTGEANKLSLTQSGNSGSGTNPANIADLIQQGGNNSMVITQAQLAGGQNTLYSSQVGNGNGSTIKQTGASFAITQSNGDNNTIALTQDNTSAGGATATRNVALIFQNGGGNNANVTQTGGNNVLNLTQNGNYLNYSVTQTGGQSVSLVQTKN